MRIASITLKNFKGVTGTFTLDALNLIVGPNGSGKTAILQAIQWAIEGRTSIGGTLEATAQLGSVTGCRVTVDLDDGFEWSRELRRDNREHKLSELLIVADGRGLIGKAAQAAIVEHVGRNGELFAPMFDLHNFLDLSEDKRRDFVMGLCSQAASGEVPLDVLEQIIHEFYVLTLGEGTVGDRENAKLLPKLSEAQQLALATIADAITLIRDRPSIVETLAATAEAVRDIALRSKKTKDEARQAARRLADEKAAATIIAENLDSMEARLTATHTSINEIGEQIANQAGRVSARSSIARTIELNQLKMRNLAAIPEEQVDDAALSVAEGRITLLQAQPYIGPDVQALRHTADKIRIQHAQAQCQERDLAHAAETLQRTKERLAVDIATARGGSWMIVSRKLADALKHVMSESLRSALGEVVRVVEREAKDGADRVLELSAQLATTERDLAAAQPSAFWTAQVQTLFVALAEADAALAATYAEQSKIDVQRSMDHRELDALRRQADGLRKVKMQRDVREREIKSAQDAMLAAQRQLDQLDAEGGFVPVAELETQRNALIEQVKTIQATIAAKRRAMATDEQLTKCLAAAERDEVLHATAETMRDAIRVVRESLMVQLVEPLLGHMRTFLAAALGEDHIPYCRLEKDNGKPIFELGWNVGESRVSEPALSGGERAIYGAALAYALVRLADPPLKLLMIEAAEADDERSEAMFRALGELPGIDAAIVVTWHAETFVGGDKWNEIRLPTAGVTA